MSIENEEFDYDLLKYWTDKDGNRVYGNPKKYNKSLEYLMSYDPKKVVSKRGIRIRKIFHPVFNRIIPLTSKSKLKVIKTYNSSGERIKVPKDRRIIFVPNHGFKDDIALTLKTAKHHAYMVFASIPDFFYTIDGYALWMNGVFMADRRDKMSKGTLLDKVDYAFDLGLKRVVICPEGVWNKSPNELVLHYWKGAYLAAKKNDALLMPISLLNKDMKIDGDVGKGKRGVCYSMLGEPIDPKNMSWEDLEEKLREAIATNRYELMEKYSQARRDSLGYTTYDYWSEYVKELIDSTHTLKGCRIVTPDGEEYIGESRLYDYEVENNHKIPGSSRETGAEYAPKTYYSRVEGIEKEYIREEDVYKEFNERSNNVQVLKRTLTVPKKKMDYYE